MLKAQWSSTTESERIFSIACTRRSVNLTEFLDIMYFVIKASHAKGYFKTTFLSKAYNAGKIQSHLMCPVYISSSVPEGI